MPATKRVRTQQGETILARISRLVAALPPAAPSNADLNPLADLVAVFKRLRLIVEDQRKADENRKSVHTAIHALKAIFEHLIETGRIHGVPRTAKVQKRNVSGDTAVDRPTDELDAVKVWLSALLQDYVRTATSVAVSHWDPLIRQSAMSAVLNIVRTESIFLTSLHTARQAQFASTTFATFVGEFLTRAHAHEDVLSEWSKWWDRYDDIRFHFLLAVADLLKGEDETNPVVARNLLDVLLSLTTMPTAQAELNEWWAAEPRPVQPVASRKRKAAPSDRADGSTGVFDSSSSEESDSDAASGVKLSSRARKRRLPPALSLLAHRKAFQNAWLALLALRLDEAASKRVLLVLHRQVLPHMPDPRRIMDWLLDCTNAGGTLPLLALNGLFTLIVLHNLDLPDFYTRLYALVDQDVLHIRYRPRFFRLLETFMSSSHLPASIVASFVKRLCRLALTAPPSAIVSVIPFTYNMLKLHPACTQLIHREDASPSGTDDPFDMHEGDPTRTNALNSSLWEMAALRSHYLASISGLAKVFGETLTKQNYVLEDFLDHSYGTMLDSEAKREIRKAPALAPVPARQPIRDSFFPSQIDPEEGSIDIVGRLWSFKGV